MDVISNVESQLESLKRAHEERKRAVEAIHDEREALEAREKTLEERATTLEQAAAELERRQAELASQTDEVASTQGTLAARATELERRAQEIEENESRLEGVGKGLETKAGELSAREAAIRAERDELEKISGEAGALRAELDAARKAADAAAGEAASARAEAESARTEAASAGAAKDEAGKKIKGLEAEIRELSEGEGSASQTLDRLTAERDRLAEELGEARASLAEASTVGGSQDEAVQSLRSELEALGIELEKANARATKAEAALKAGKAQRTGPVSEDREVLDLRRDRLRRQRDMLRSHTGKLRRAGEALRSRHEQCEQILAKRAELAAAHRSIAEREARLMGQRAKGGSAWVMLASLLTIGVCGLIGWFASGQVAPGLYASSVTLVAEGGSRGLSDEDLAGWQAYHEELLLDPRLIENVADRLGRRGIGSLSSPGALGQTLQDDLDWQSGTPGELELELVGHGSAQTERVLDTYAVAIASMANANRARRSDGAMTRVRDGSSETVGALDTSRIMAAGMIGGVLAMVSLTLGFLAWLKMRQGKDAYENAPGYGALETSGWPDREPGSAAA